MATTRARRKSLSTPSEVRCETSKEVIDRRFISKLIDPPDKFKTGDQPDIFLEQLQRYLLLNDVHPSLHADVALSCISDSIYGQIRGLPDFSKKRGNFGWISDVIRSYDSYKRQVDYILELGNLKMEEGMTYESFLHKVRFHVSKALEEKLTVEALTKVIFIEGILNDETRRHFRMKEKDYSTADIVAYCKKFDAANSSKRPDLAEIDQLRQKISALDYQLQHMVHDNDNSVPQVHTMTPRFSPTYADMVKQRRNPQIRQFGMNQRVNPIRSTIPRTRQIQVEPNQCWLCRGHGHFRANCPNRNVCFSCGSPGHRHYQCHNRNRQMSTRSFRQKDDFTSLTKETKNSPRQVNQITPYALEEFETNDSLNGFHPLQQGTSDVGSQ